MAVNALVFEALKLMGIGVGMVFAVLAIFYGMVKALMFLLPEKQKEENE